MAPRTKRNRHPQNVEWSQTNAADQHQSDGHKWNVPDFYPDAKEKPTIPTTISQTTILENQNGTGAHDHNRRKSLPPPIGPSIDSYYKQNKTTIWIHRRFK